MRKYIILFLQHLSEYSTYRMRLLVTILQGFVTPLFLLIVLSWARPISSVSVSDLLPYYLLVGLIYPLTRSRIDEFIDESATSGEVNNFLVKPLSFYKFMLTSDLSWKTLNLITLFPFILAAYLLLTPSGSVPQNLSSFSLSLLVTGISFLISFNFSFLIGLFSFWLDEFWAIHNIKHVVVNFLGGVVLPYSFFPLWATSLLKYSPFPYMLTWPVRVLRGQFSSSEIPISLFWLALIGLAVVFFQKLAIRRYSHTAG
ncbi:hypothetical protein A3H89_04845 [Candidatus Amesbacteria bacterium RIFCSPLOWO2_02_FULL_48_11]|uniref:ABC transporter permease n=4 Tax=Candidatus Amesiibacteriota TaxID=1752730 RepID=A0A1F4ZFE5_9BACT|nr:MAG: hypothetical protein UX78_C0023G0013 [Candidatus Amesbacteria bacterium GW2011_GWA2_47_11]KKW00090.1 MAG: hypothetical protein UY33_C0016G0014 [Candidatus Amesbacteria bacterium GW2011_GWA1_48_9]OGC90180.1 MAG: hypothetical protein A2V48_01450 [Candidatus Amesbacteria bacterium RBG_19FT_COMBO_48_16]OGC95864.1 MAG: hypothetical protein A3C34_04010 [Candidatus Amesbacteria bacterium RIFCSPHIGHO2_02_FULL_48_21]OGC99618.1 MAG: hypothetical protein A2702_02030 [Candidatus Amesbacteria bacter